MSEHLSEEAIADAIKKFARGEIYPEDLKAILQQALSTRDQENARLKEILAKQGYEISQTLGKALGYITDDPDSNVGEHIAETLADEASRELARLKEGLRLTQENHIKSIEERDRLNEKYRMALDGCDQYMKAEVQRSQELGEACTENRRLNARIAEMEKELKQIRFEHGNLVEIYNNALTAIGAKDDDIYHRLPELITARITDLERERDELQSQNASFRNSSKACEDCDAVTMEEVKKLRADLEAKEKEVERLKDERDPDINWLEDRATDAEAECDELRAKLTDSEARCGEMEDALRKAAEVFEAYAKHHESKGSHDKARANQLNADACRQLLKPSTEK